MIIINKIYHLFFREIQAVPWCVWLKTNGFLLEWHHLVVDVLRNQKWVPSQKSPIISLGLRKTVAERFQITVFLMFKGRTFPLLKFWFTNDNTWDQQTWRNIPIKTQTLRIKSIKRCLVENTVVDKILKKYLILRFMFSGCQAESQVIQE